MKWQRIMRNYLPVLVFGLALCAIGAGRSGTAEAADWPNWRGPNRNGVSSETGWSTSWPKGGPKELWRASIGTGFSSIAVSNGRVYTMGNIDEKDITYCMDAETGKVVWKRSYPSPLDAKQHEGGPHATPTVDGNRVYTLSQRGKVFCRDAKTGDFVWSKDLKKELGVERPEWGLSGSPLIINDMVILNAGTWGVALNKADGSLIWENGNGPAGYATAVPFTVDGQKHVVLFGCKAAAGLLAATGEKKWEHPWKTMYNINAADPIVSGDTIFISSGYNKGCALLKVKADDVTEVRRDKSIRNQCNSSVLWKGHLYGFDGQVGGGGILTCLNHETLEVKWTKKGMGTGSLMLADGKLIILGERGRLVIAEASPKRFQQLASAQILTGKCWTVPVLANGRIYARNADGDLVCVDVRGSKKTAPVSARNDWPQFRGPNRDGKSKETGLLKSWPEQGPPLAWKIPGLGKGFSSISIADGKIFTMGDRNDEQLVIALDLATRRELWASKVGAPWKTGKGGPRCTPTLDGELLYAIGTHGDLVCLETASGKERWRKNFARDFGGKMMSKWGYSESPLVDGDKLLCTPGAKDAALVALDKKTGKTIWKCSVPDLGPKGKDGAGYSSIVTADLAGTRQYIQMMGRGLVGVSAENGRFLWGYNKIANDTANIPSAVVDGDYVFCTTSYKTGSALLKLVPTGNGIKAEEVYFLGPKEFENHHGGVVLLDGYIYGGDGQNRGRPVCLEMKTGKIMWKEQPVGKKSAALLYADKHLYFRYENALMALVEATPESFNVKGTFNIASKTGPSWPHPVILDGKLYLRDNDVLLCYDISSGS